MKKRTIFIKAVIKSNERPAALSLDQVKQMQIFYEVITEYQEKLFEIEIKHQDNGLTVADIVDEYIKALKKQHTVLWYEILEYNFNLLDK